MKIHAKTLLIFSIAVVLLCVAAFVLTYQIILSQFDQLERGLMLQRVERFHIDVQSRLKPVAAAVTDWSTDERFARLAGGEQSSFGRVELGNEMLRNLGLSFFGVWDADGKFVSGRLDSATGTGTSTLPSGLIEALQEDGFIKQARIGDSASGRVLLDGRICFASASPIRTDSDGNDIAGVVVGGTFLTPSDLREIELFSGYELRVVPIEKLSRAGILGEVLAKLRAGENPVIEPISDEEIAGFSIQNDFHGNPLFLAELVSPRVLYIAGAKSSRFFLSGLVMVCAVLFFLIWYLLDRTVLSPILLLGERVDAASRAGELPNDLGIKGDDEVATLARQIEQLARSVREAEARYRTIVEEQQEFIVRYAPDGILTFVNRAFASFVGANQTALVGSNMASLFPDEERAELERRIEKLSPATPTFAIDQRFLRDGEEYWLSRFDRGEFDPSGALVGVQSVMQDVTESRRAETELQESEARYRTFFEAAADGIMIVDGEEERILDVNPGLTLLFGWPKEHFMGEIFWKLSTFQRLVDRIASVKSTVLWPGIRRLQGVELRRRNGDPVFVDVITVSYMSSGRQVVQWNFRDVTAALQSENALRQLSGRLLKLQDEERRRIARELHDSTGQNLTALTINLSRLDGTSLGATPEAQQLLQECRGLADRCSAEIRTISYLLHPPLLDEVGLAFAVKWFAEGFSKRTAVPVEIHISADFPRLAPEAETSLFRVVQEAMSNIHRHSGSTETSVEVAIAADEVLVEIRDNGAGMSEDLVDAVNNSNSSLGVGLAGMRERIAQLGGNLRVSSNSTGTRVRATIPLDEVSLCPTSAF